VEPCNRILARFAICLLFVGIKPAFAKLFEFKEQDYRKSSAFRGEVEKLEAGDEVRVIDKEGKVWADFKLLQDLGGGKMGRVFKAYDESNRVVALKLQRNNRNAGLFMFEEIKALKILKSLQVPIAKMGRYDHSIFIEKQFVEGETLLVSMGRWDEIPVEDRALRMERLSELYHRLLAQKVSFSDIHEDNIMWDNNDQAWKIVDPGWAKKKGGKETVQYLSERIDIEGSPEVRRAYHLAIEFPQWAVRYVRLQNAVAELEKTRNGAAIDSFFEEQSAGADAPREYRELWSEGLARVNALYHLGHETPFLHCIVREFEKKGVAF
jgi:serine/threonine protein kinase